jgi:uncharacterized protein YeaO (DUF488 family)
MTIALKNARAGAARDDGYRILIDRVWPRGLSKERLQLDEWNKDIAPSAGLRKWFGHDRGKWDEFKQRYFRELDERPEAVRALIDKIRKTSVTLVFAARDTYANHALALKEYLERKGAK